MSSKKQIATRKKNLTHDSASQSRRRLHQIAWEEKIANEFRSKGWEIFSPTVVCDRIGIKNGKVYFIEFKKNGQELREGQKKVKEKMPKNYLVVFR